MCSDQNTEKWGGEPSPWSCRLLSENPTAAVFRRLNHLTEKVTCSITSKIKNKKTSKYSQNVFWKFVPVHVINSVCCEVETLYLWMTGFESTGGSWENRREVIIYTYFDITYYKHFFFLFLHRWSTYYFFLHSLARSILNSGRLTNPSAFSSWTQR